MKMIQLLVIFLLLSACAGYKPKNKNNPFAQYGIECVSVPIFINNTVFPKVSSVFTASFIDLLNSFKGLEVKVGESKSCESILVGIIESKSHLNSALKTKDQRIDIENNSSLLSSIGNRRAFYVSSKSQLMLSLKIVLIKNPSIMDRLLIKSKYSNYLGNHPKVVISKTLDLVGEFARIVNSNQTSDDGGAVNFTKNKALEDETIKGIARSAVNTFKEVVLYVF